MFVTREHQMTFFCGFPIVGRNATKVADLVRDRDRYCLTGSYLTSAVFLPLQPKWQASANVHFRLPNLRGL